MPRRASLDVKHTFLPYPENQPKNPASDAQFIVITKQGYAMIKQWDEQHKSFFGGSILKAPELNKIVSCYAEIHAKPIGVKFL